MPESNPEVGLHTALDSPPAASNGDADVTAREARQRLFELRTVLTERFDRRSWDEYVRLRRARKNVEV